MSAPDPEGFSLAAKVFGAIAVIAAPIWGFVKLWDKKADKAAVRDSFDKIDAELGLHRKYFAKVFDQMREMDQKAADRHAELLDKIYEVRK